MAIIYVLIAIIIFLIFIYIVSLYNNFVSLQNNNRKNWANIDVLLKQRNNEIPNLIASVKGYMRHEKELLERLTKLRSKTLTGSRGLQAAADSELSLAIKSIFALAENYPQLKANENFLQLQGRITALENELADRREFYNESVTIYNTRREVFPDFMIARLFKFRQEQLFRATPEERRKFSVKI